MHPSWTWIGIAGFSAAVFFGCGQSADTGSDGPAGSGGGVLTTSTTSTMGTAGGGMGGGSSSTGLPTTGITIIVEPDGLSGEQIVDAIAAAQSSVHMTMYILTDSHAIEALKTASQGGKDVRVVLNKSFPDGGNANISAYDELRGAGVGVVWASSKFTFTHEKAFVIDGTTAWIMTMNVASSSPDGNREYLAIDTIPEHVAQTEAVFEADYGSNGDYTDAGGPLLVAPLNAEQAIRDFIHSATTSIDIEAEELSDDGILDDLVAAHQGGIAVRVILSSENRSTAQQEAVNRMTAIGMQVVELDDPYVHAKTLVVDRTSAYVGSANFTFYSLTANRELGLLMAVPSEIAKITGTIDQDFASGTPL
jgi:phosphatidylserine/phosphatidylglycerophosphate/cardiolipin synthase-like enzyme